MTASMMCGNPAPSAFRALIYPHSGHANVLILLANLTIMTASMMCGNLAPSVTRALICPH